MSFIGKPTNYLPFGAVKINKFPKAVPCTSNAEFCQPTIQDDNIAFQFEVSESEELLTNGDFTDGSSSWNPIGWSVSGVLSSTDTNKHACLVSASSPNGIYQPGLITLGDFYKITITTSGRTTGTLAVGTGTGILLFQANFIQGNGTEVLFFFGTNKTDFTIISTSDFDGCVESVSLIKISVIADYTIQIHDADTLALIDTVPTANIRQSQNIITVDFNWADDVTVSNGCRMIRIFNDVNSFEDDFSTDQGWTLGDQTLITGGGMNYTSTGANNGAKIGGIFIPGESYEITYDVFMTGTGTSQVNAGKTLGTVRTVPGTYVEELTAAFLDTLGFKFTGAGGSTVTIDNIFITKTNNLDGQSECYDLQDSHDCSLLLKWSNNESWGSFDYSLPSTGTAFLHKLRVIAKFRGTKYPSTKNIGENSAGVKSIDYTSLRKVVILDVHRAPDYIHDGIAAMFMQDTRLIEDVSYIMIDDYEPSSPNDSRVLWKDMMTSRTELEETTQPNQINRT